MTATPAVDPPAAKAPSAGSFASSAVTAAENAAVREARDLPDLIRRLEVANPVLAAQFVGKSLAASRTPWGTLLLPVVAYLAARYGLGWPPDIDALMAGVAVLIGSYVMRFMTSTPITSLFRQRRVIGPTPAPIAAAGAVAGNVT